MSNLANITTQQKPPHQQKCINTIMHIKEGIKNRFNHIKNNENLSFQAKLSVSMMMIAIVDLHFLQITPAKYFIYHSCLHSGFSALTVWSIAMSALPFPDESSTSNLRHQTTSWKKIKNKKFISPTADASIYFIDSNLKKYLGDYAGSKKITTVEFKGAKKYGIEKITGHPFSWKRFKMGRGEWISPKYHLLKIHKFTRKDKLVIITSFSLEEITGKALNILKLRSFLASFFLCVPLWAAALSLIPFDLVNPERKSWCDSYTIKAFIIFSIIGALLYFLQRIFNCYTFSLIEKQLKKNLNNHTSQSGSRRKKLSHNTQKQ